MLNAIKEQQAEIAALTRSIHEKGAEIQELTQQTQASRKAQLNLQRRLEQVELKTSNSPAAAPIREVTLLR